MRFSTPKITSLLLVLSPLLNTAEAAPNPEPVPAVLGTVVGPAGPQSAKRQTTICDNPDYPINCANGYCCPYNTLCDGSTCDQVTVKNGAFANVKATQELALALGIIGGVFVAL